MVLEWSHCNSQDGGSLAVRQQRGTFSRRATRSYPHPKKQGSFEGASPFFELLLQTKTEAWVSVVSIHRIASQLFIFGSGREIIPLFSHGLLSHRLGGPWLRSMGLFGPACSRSGSSSDPPNLWEIGWKFWSRRGSVETLWFLWSFSPGSFSRQVSTRGRPCSFPSLSLE